LLRRWSYKSLHENEGEVVMEDSRHELQKHLAIWLNATGRVLVTGLGLGCVVRGLLASPQVEHITVVELDPQILRIVGHEFQFNPRVTLIRGDALTVQLTGQFDYAWHDLWTDGDEHLQVLHAKLLARFRDQCRIQGAWNLPRHFKRAMPKWVLR
jgi:spermidine synthase